MNSETWWDYFDEDPYEKVGRFVPNAFGTKMAVNLTRIGWEYVDWLTNVEGCNMDQFFIDNDQVRLPTDGCVHEWMQGAVYTCFLRRERKGYRRPAWLQPALPAEYMDI